MDFVIGLPVFPNWKGKTYDLILVIVDQITKMVNYELIKVTINTLGLVEVIINDVVRDYDLPDLIVSNQGSVFISKFWSSVCYSLGIKRRLFTAFHSQTDG